MPTLGLLVILYIGVLPLTYSFLPLLRGKVAILYSDLLDSSLNSPLLPTYKVIDIISNRVSIPIIILVSITNLTSTLFSTYLRFRYS